MEENRRTGRSTAQALRILHMCYTNPGVPIDIRDHAEYISTRTNAYLAETVMQMAYALDLHGYVLRKGLKPTITYIIPDILKPKKEKTCNCK